MHRGQFITIEGSEGAGKSTQIKRLTDYLKEQGIEHVLTREPGGTPLAEKIRAILLDKENTSLCDDTELLLMFAARAQHLHEIILPALNSGMWVVSDRFTDATYAYQGGGRGLPEDKIALLEQLVQNDLRPDLTLLLDCPLDIGLQRVIARGETDRFEKENSPFFTRVRERYLKLAEQYPERIKVINSALSIEEVWLQIQRVMEPLVHLYSDIND